jgi:DNA-binding MarR family transcriptional regulator
VYEGPSEGVRMTQLAEATLLSKSRLSHCVDRLSKLGLLHRERVVDDRRGLLAVLSESGRARVVQLAEEHFDDVRSYTVDVVSDEEARFVAGLADRWTGAVHRRRSTLGGRPGSELDPTNA